MWIVRLFWDYVVVRTKFKSFIIFVGTFTHHYFTFLANTNYPLGKKAEEMLIKTDITLLCISFGFQFLNRESSDFAVQKSC